MTRALHQPAGAARIVALLVPLAVVSAALLAPSRAGAQARTLRVCADPNNMPFSNRARAGFENRIAALLADDLHARLAYYWWAQRRGFVRNTLSAGTCDVVVGIVPGTERVLTTAPYYRSTYVFVTRRDRQPAIASFDDPRLGGLRIGVHVIGADYNSLPPAVALARRGLVHNVAGYSIYGNYARESPPSKLIAAVALGDVDVAVAWGPLAGYYARRSALPLTITPVATPMAAPGIPFAYDIAAGVRPNGEALRVRLDRALVRHRTEIRRILRAYGVPLVGDPTLGGMGRPRRCSADGRDRECA